MANTFKVVNFAAEPASAGTPYVMYTVASNTTTVVLGLVLANIHTTAVTAEVELVSTTSNRGGANNLDAAYDLRGNNKYNTCDISIQSRWRFINKCSLRPDSDKVDSLHTYYYTYTADKDTLSFDFKDNSYSDNSGSLIFQLFNISSISFRNLR